MNSLIRFIWGFTKKIIFKPYIDAGVSNEDANWEEKFWEPLTVKNSGNAAFVTAQTFKTHFVATTFMQNSIFINDKNQKDYKNIRFFGKPINLIYKDNFIQNSIYGGIASILIIMLVISFGCLNIIKHF
jgi:hypothetical protein